MEMIECPVCELFLRPNMNLQDHLDTHPKEMIIKALLSANKPKIEEEPPKTIFLQPAPSPVPQMTQIYHQPQQQQQIKAENQYFISKHPINHQQSIFSTNGNTGNYRIQQITVDSMGTPQNGQNIPTILNPTTATPMSAPQHSPQAFRCIQNSEKSNMIASNQLINQLAGKKQQAQSPSVEILPAGQVVESGIALFPRYTSEKYSGPPPPYSTAISSSTCSVNEQQTGQPKTTLNSIRNSYIDLTQETSSKNDSEKCSRLKNKHLLVTTSPQKIMEYAQDESGEFVITEKLVDEQHYEGPGIGRYEMALPDHQYNITIDQDQEEQYVDDNMDVDEGSTVKQDLPQMVIGNDDETEQKFYKKTGLKVLSNVKVTSQHFLSENIKDIILKYHNVANEEEIVTSVDEPEQQEESREVKVEDIPEQKKREKVDKAKKIEEPQPSTSSAATAAETSVIRRTRLSTYNAENKIAPVGSFLRKFGRNSNRLTKQPKKLIVKLKKPLVVAPEESEEEVFDAPSVSIIKEEEQPNEEMLEDVREEEPSVENKMGLDTYIVSYFDGSPAIEIIDQKLASDQDPQSVLEMKMEMDPNELKHERLQEQLIIKVETSAADLSSTCSSSSEFSNSPHKITSMSSTFDNTAGPSRISSSRKTSNAGPSYLYTHDRRRFSPPLSPDGYIQTFGGQRTMQQSKIWHHDGCTPTSSLDENRSRSYMEIDMHKTNSSSLNNSNSNSCHELSQKRSGSIDSLNIRTDEKMPARGEISEQESNGEIEPPWHHQFYPIQGIMPPQYPSSYDMSTAQECWNLSKHDSQNACDSNIIQNVIINFPPLNQNQENDEDVKPVDLLKDIIITKSETVASGSIIDNLLSRSMQQKTRARSFRCPECPKVFMRLKQRRKHMLSEHNYPEGKTVRNRTSSTITSAQATVSNKPISDISLPTSIVKCEVVQASTSNIITVKNEMNRIIMNYSMLKQELTFDTEPKMEMLEPSTSSQPPMMRPIVPMGLKMKRTYICATCKEEFKTLRLFDRHLRIHPAECVACGKTFHNWVNFSIHLKRHLNIKNHVCRFCTKRFVIRQKLVEHMRVHTGSAPLKCAYCSERFRRYSNLIQHRNRVHLHKKPSKKDYVCECGEIYATKAKLIWHQETHDQRPKACPYCRERFTHRNSLTRHIRLSHTDKYTFVKNKTIDCPICHATYLSSSIKAHMQTHSNVKKEYSCAICTKCFSTKWNLKQHSWTHASRSSKPFQCTQCSSAFIRETDFVTHMNAHKSIKPYTCNHCGCQFVRKYNWLRHTREHEKDKKFSCETCGKKFHRAYYLTEHKRVHSGERPFSCNICGKTSATKTNHNKHIKIHHARDPLTAEG